MIHRQLQVLYYLDKLNLLINMRILLIKPGEFFEKKNNYVNLLEGSVPPLGLAYLAARAEKDGHVVKILDMEAEPMSAQYFKRYLLGFSPEIVGISLTVLTFHLGARVAFFIREFFGQVPILVGGPGFTLYPEEIIKHSCFDYGLVGEADYSFPNFLNFISGKSDEVPHGLIYKKGGKIITNGSSPIIVENLDQLPLPARHLFGGKYLSPLPRYEPSATMITSRGCPFRCEFCSRVPGEDLLRLRSAQNVIMEFKEIVSSGYKEVRLYDDVFTFDKKRTLDICGGLISGKIKTNWTILSRADSLDEEILTALKESGCYRISIGVESGSDRILKLMNKGTTIKMIREKVDLIKRFKIEVSSFIMIGFPGETDETMKETAKFLSEINPDHCVFTMFCPMPGSPFFTHLPGDSSVKNGFADFLSLKTPDFPVYYGSLNREIREKQYHRLVKIFYLRPKNVFNFLKSINSPGKIKNYAPAIIGLFLSFLMKKDIYPFRLR